MNHESTSFLAGCVAAADYFLFAKQIDEDAGAGAPNTSFFAHDEGAWSVFPDSAGWSCIAMATCKPEGALRTVVAIGASGQWWETQPATLSTATGRIEGVRGHLRSLRVIGGAFYAVGMGRRVYRREAPGDWRAMHAPEATAEQGVIGFEDMDAFDEGDLYAVGWQGEIWRRHTGRWMRVQSPVSANLNAVCCASDGVVYVVGDEGVMLRGRGDAWQIIETGRGDNLMDVAEHQGQIYVVTDFRILKLQEGRLVAERDFEDDDPPHTCLMLEPGPGALLSIGPSQVMVRTDRAWMRLD